MSRAFVVSSGGDSNGPVKCHAGCRFRRGPWDGLNLKSRHGSVRERKHAGIEACMHTESDMQTTIDILHDLEHRRFYGSVELKFEGGRIVLLRKTETMKPGDVHCRNNRGESDERTEPN